MLEDFYPKLVPQNKSDSSQEVINMIVDEKLLIIWFYQIINQIIKGELKFLDN